MPGKYDSKDLKGSQGHVCSRKKKVEESTLELLVEEEEGKRLFVHFLLEGLNQEAMTVLAERFTVAREYTESERDTEFARRIGIRKYAPEERMALEIASLLHYFDYRKRLLANAPFQLPSDG